MRKSRLWASPKRLPFRSDITMMREPSSASGRPTMVTVLSDTDRLLLLSITPTASSASNPSRNRGQKRISRPKTFSGLNRLSLPVALIRSNSERYTRRVRGDFFFRAALDFGTFPPGFLAFPSTLSASGFGLDFFLRRNGMSPSSPYRLDSSRTAWPSASGRGTLTFLRFLFSESGMKPSSHHNIHLFYYSLYF